MLGVGVIVAQRRKDAMPCYMMRLADGGVAIVCARGRQGKQKRCHVCNCPESITTMKLCDYPVAGKKRSQTCDKPICIEHALHVEPDTDYCPEHAKAITEKHHEVIMS
jgi:hypothetical protein